VPATMPTASRGTVATAAIGPVLRASSGGVGSASGIRRSTRSAMGGCVLLSAPPKVALPLDSYMPNFWRAEANAGPYPSFATASSASCSIARCADADAGTMTQVQVDAVAIRILQARALGRWGRGGHPRPHPVRAADHRGISSHPRRRRQRRHNRGGCVMAALPDPRTSTGTVVGHVPVYIDVIDGTVDRVRVDDYGLAVDNGGFPRCGST